MDIDSEAPTKHSPDEDGDDEDPSKTDLLSASSQRVTISATTPRKDPNQGQGVASAGISLEPGSLRSRRFEAPDSPITPISAADIEMRLLSQASLQNR